MIRTLRRFYSFVLRYWPSFFAGILLFIVAGALANLQPFFIKWITERVQVGDFSQALTFLFYLALVLLIQNIISNIAYFIGDKSMVHTSTDMAESVLKHIHDLDFSYHVNKSSGKLISLMKRGDDAYYTYYDIIHRGFLDTAISVVMMSASFFVLKPSYALIVAAMVVVSISLSIILVKQNLKKRLAFNRADDEVSSARVDNLVNFDTVKYFAREKYEQTRFQSLLKVWYSTLQQYFFTFRYFDLSIGNLTSAAIVGLLILGVFDLQKGAITLAEFLFLASFATALFPRMMHVLFEIRDLAKKYDDLDKYLSLLDEPITVADPIQEVALQNPRGEVTFDHVDFSYHEKEVAVLKDFSITMKPGEVVAFVGYSGAGKTTITKLLMRMYDPTSGQVLIDGVDIRSMRKSSLRSLIGLVPQDPLLFNNTVRYNIAYARPESTEDEIIEAAKKAQAHSFILSLQKGYESVVGERGIKLSGGQRQRLAIARVLLKQPTIVVFDEATAALDSESERAIQEAFWNMVRDPQHPKTSIIIAHRLSTIMRADRIVVLDQGEIQEIGTHDELLEKQGIYARLWGLQKNGFIGDGEETEE